MPLEAGADDFIIKPFKPAEMQARVRSLLRVKALFDEGQRQRAALADWSATLEQRVAAGVAQVVAPLAPFHAAMGRFTGDGMMVFFNAPTLCPRPAKGRCSWRWTCSGRLQTWHRNGNVWAARAVWRWAWRVGRPPWAPSALRTGRTTPP